MPNIINEVKLDFKDVLLRPKRSTLKSRNDVSLDFMFSMKLLKDQGAKCNVLLILGLKMFSQGSF